MFSRKPGDRDSSGRSYTCFCPQSDVVFANNRISAGLSRRGFVVGMAASLLMQILPRLASAQTAPVPSSPAQPILFTNFRLFDGTSGKLRDGLYLLVDGNRVHTLSQNRPTVPEGSQVIDCGARVLMPGLIDMHWHTMIAAVPLPTLLTADIGLIHIAASAEAERTLMRGFTTVRDAGGPAFALKQAIDGGLISGPRIYPSGAMITTTGGHGDFRPLTDVPRTTGRVSASEQSGGSIIADSADEVRKRVREQFMQGASQIKLMSSGGVSTPRSPLDMLTFTEAQVRAAVEVTQDWGSYVMVHAFPPAAIQRAMAAGVQCIEHGHLMDDATASLMAKNGTWLSIQPFVSAEDFVPLTGPSLDKIKMVFAGTNNAYTLAKKHGIKTGFGSDLLFSPVLATRQGTMLTHLLRWHTATEALQMATAQNGQLLALSGPRNPYPAKLGVVQEGAYADLLLVDGDPTQNLALIADPAKNLRVIMKDGKIYKNTLGA
ncbi:amidohydrolase family protein [Paraburkholderia sp. JHI869]|uniref:metal-dependent hydrolase family protein n=1 Tax=Paraburkholderia sp. JHI869 TaxID=3112959 RepID=UPI003178F260